MVIWSATYTFTTCVGSPGVLFVFFFSNFINLILIFFLKGVVDVSEPSSYWSSWAISSKKCVVSIAKENAGL